METGVNINTTKRKFFTQFLFTVRPILKPHLSKGELKVLGELLYFNDKYKDIELKTRSKLLLDYDNKVEITENLSISQNTLANTLTALRVKGYLKNNTITKGLGVFPEETHTVTYNFKINDGVEDK